MSYARIVLVTLTIAQLAMAEGTDLILADTPVGKKWGTIDGVSGYSFSHIYCNIGDEPAAVLQGAPAHPVITTSIYRLMSGRLEQIGQGFAFHEYCTLQNAFCGVCTPVETGCIALGPGCSNTTGSSIAGAQQRLESRRDINPATGVISWPIPGFGDLGDLIYKRVQVANADMDPAMNPGATYFIESRIVATDDGFYENGLNNAACRPVAVGPMFEGGPILTPSASPTSQTTAVELWATLDPTVQVSHVTLGNGQEKFLLGSKATANGDGSWTYEYALENYSSVQGAGSFRVPLGGSGASGAGFHDVSYHSGDPFDGTDWGATVDGTYSIQWAATLTWDEDPNANALRWGTTYNFRFVATSGPVNDEVTIGLFAPGDAEAVAAAALVPACFGDANSNGAVDFEDVTWVLSSWGSAGPLGDADHDGDVDFGDVSAILARFGGGC
jgi:hypothetical protein